MDSPSCRDWRLPIRSHGTLSSGSTLEMMTVLDRAAKAAGSRAVVLLRPRATLLHQLQLVPRGHALLASAYALSTCPLHPAVRVIGKLSPASATDLHDVLESSPYGGREVNSRARDTLLPGLSERDKREGPSQGGGRIGPGVETKGRGCPATIGRRYFAVFVLGFQRELDQQSGAKPVAFFSGKPHLSIFVWSHL